MQSLGDRLAGARRRLVSIGHGVGEWRDQSDPGGEQHQCALPAVGGDQHLADRQHSELAEGAASAGDAECQAAPLGGRVAADDAHDDGEGGAGQAKADQHAGREIESQRRGGIGHQNQPDDIEHGGAEHRAPGAVTVGERPGKR